MSKAAVYAKNSNSWLQLVNILLYVWNAFNFNLFNPLELTQTDAWRYVVLLAECSLQLIEYLQNGGKLRKVAGQDIDEIKNQKPSFHKDRTVAFAFDEEDEQTKVKLPIGAAKA